MAKASPPRGAIRKCATFLLVVFLTHHALAVCVTLLPQESYLGSQIMPYFHWYRWVTGTTQNWGMFTTPVTNQKVQVTVRAHDASGDVVEFGPRVPGLLDYESPHMCRFYSLFTNYSQEPYSAYREAYARNLAAALEKRGSFTSFDLLTEMKRTCDLKDIREENQQTYDVEVVHRWDLDE